MPSFLYPWFIWKMSFNSQAFYFKLSKAEENLIFLKNFRGFFSMDLLKCFPDVVTWCY